MISLSSHVLDTSRGQPVTGIALRLLDADGILLFTGVTDLSGRCSGMTVLRLGRYRLEFSVADYFRGLGFDLPNPPFLDVIAVEFGLAVAGHHHVPLLISPYGYSTYRGG